MDERRVPRIRFKGFEEDWEQRKVSEMFKITRGYVLSATVTTEYPDDENRYPVYSSQTAFNGLLGYYKQYLYENAVTWTTDGANAGTVRYRDGKFYCTNVCGVLLSDVIKASKMVAEALNEISKKYVSYVGNPKLMNNVMAEIVIAFPPQQEEQDATSGYFNLMDSLLSLHQRKLEKLKILKKAMLEKTFPKNGAKVPEIRFSGFTDDWEQRKLEEVASETRGGGTPKTSNETYWNGDIPWIQSSDLKEDELFEVKPRKYVSKIGLSKSATQLVEANSIAVVTRVGVGKLALMPHSYATSQDFVSLSRLQVASYFAVYSIHHMLQEELEVVQGTSIKGMTKEDLLSKSLLIPVDIGEQTRLGGLFYKLDSLLSLHQRKLEKLRQIKKSMLERMFV